MHIEISYQPLPWAVPFHGGDWEHSCLAGGLGSGKSTAALEELKACAIENPGFTYFIGRKHLPSLRDTTLRTFRNVFEPQLIDRWNEANLTCRLINGSEFIFRPLDDDEKLKSLEIAGFFVNEANEISQSTYNTLKSRVRQKVDGRAPLRYRTILDLNPTDEDHWIPQLFLKIRPPGHKLFHSSTLDNAANLPAGYIESLKNTYTEAELERLLRGFFTKVFAGRPVFPFFKPNRMTYINPELAYNPAFPLIRGWDFGYNHPCVQWLQFYDGRVHHLAELLGKDIYLEDFIRSEVLPTQHSTIGKVQSRIIDYCDPRGSDQSDKGRSSVQILQENGIYPTYRRTWIEEGLKALHHYATTKNKRDGRPNYQVHPRCRLTIEAWEGGYARDEGEEMPKKDGKYDHPMDSLRYPVIHIFQRAKIQEMNEAHAQGVRVYTHPVTGRRIEH